MPGPQLDAQWLGGQPTLFSLHCCQCWTFAQADEGGEKERKWREAGKHPRFPPGHSSRKPGSLGRGQNYLEKPGPRER